MKKLISIFFLILSTTVMADCKLETFDRIIKINKNQDQKIIKSTDCSQQVQQTFMSFISSASGSLNAAHLRRYFKQESQIDIEITPSSFTVSTMKGLIEENIKEGGIIVKSVTSLLSQSSLNLNQSDNLTIDCKNCKKPGQKNIVALVNNKKIWLNALIHRERTAYVLARSLVNLNQKLDASYFKQVKIADNGNTLFFNDINNIRFYKPTKLLRAGDTVKKYDLRSRVLVKFGQKVQVNILKNNIKLGTKAIARRNGHIGDVIELINQKSKKVISAKVVDFNKVEVEL